MIQRELTIQGKCSGRNNLALVLPGQGPTSRQTRGRLNLCQWHTAYMIIGEAAKHVAPSLRERFPEIDCLRIQGAPKKFVAIGNIAQVQADGRIFEPVRERRDFPGVLRVAIGAKEL